MDATMHSRRHSGHHQSYDDQPMPVPVQVISTLFFSIFAIVVVCVAFAYFWPAGLVLAIILGWRGGFAPRMHRPDYDDIAHRVMELGPEAEKRFSTGNASFDAYREETLRRLEEERESFSAFLERLRQAGDKREFDSFLDDRAEAARQAREAEADEDE